jgi:hypothetical protein
MSARTGRSVFRIASPPRHRRPMVKKMTNYPFRYFTFNSRNVIAEFIEHAVVPGGNHLFQFHSA